MIAILCAGAWMAGCLIVWAWCAGGTSAATNRMIRREAEGTKEAYMSKTITVTTTTVITETPARSGFCLLPVVLVVVLVSLLALIGSQVSNAISDWQQQQVALQQAQVQALETQARALEVQTKIMTVEQKWEAIGKAIPWVIGFCGLPLLVLMALLSAGTRSPQDPPPGWPEDQKRTFYDPDCYDPNCDPGYEVGQ